jgi:hypothetical protein
MLNRFFVFIFLILCSMQNFCINEPVRLPVDDERQIDVSDDFGYASSENINIRDIPPESVESGYDLLMSGARVAMMEGKFNEATDFYDKLLNNEKVQKFLRKNPEKLAEIYAEKTALLKKLNRDTEADEAFEKYLEYKKSHEDFVPQVADFGGKLAELSQEFIKFSTEKKSLKKLDRN